jgi:hypothetical protein
MVGCGGGAGGGLAVSDAPCVSGAVTFVGTLDGQAVAAQVMVNSVFFQQGTPPHTLDVSYEGGGTETIELAWNALVPYGKPTAVTGTFVMPQAAPEGGQKLCAGTGSSLEELAADGGGASQYLLAFRGLGSGPSCPGAAVDAGVGGSVDVCVAL